MEEELSGLDKEEKDAFLEELGVETSGLDQLIQKAYAVLDLCTFLTAGEDECRAWTFKKRRGGGTGLYSTHILRGGLYLDGSISF